MVRWEPVQTRWCVRPIITRSPAVPPSAEQHCWMLFQQLYAPLFILEHRSWIHSISVLLKVEMHCFDSTVVGDCWRRWLDLCIFIIFLRWNERRHGRYFLRGRGHCDRHGHGSVAVNWAVETTDLSSQMSSSANPMVVYQTAKLLH